MRFLEDDQGNLKILRKALMHYRNELVKRQQKEVKGGTPNPIIRAELQRIGGDPRRVDVGPPGMLARLCADGGEEGPPPRPERLPAVQEYLDPSFDPAFPGLNGRAD
jgi:hypothetical protein